MKLIHRTRWGACLAIAALVMAGATTANATLATGTLNAADGNLVVDGSEIDWANVGGIVCPSAPGGTGGQGCSLDLRQGQGDNAFGNGTKEDDAVPSIVDDSIPPNKSDLTRFYVKLVTVNNKDYAYLAWERVQDPSGTTNMDFEINKSSTLSDNLQTPVRSIGDVLITYDLSKGGTHPSLNWRSWDGTKWGAPQSLAGNFEGSVNNPTDNPNTGSATLTPGQVVDPINPNAPRTLDAFTFGEAAVNLTDSGIIPAGTCASFSSAYLKSRSSDSFTSALKDFVSPAPINFNKCGKITIIKNTVGGNGTFGWTTTGDLGVTNNSFSLTTTNNTASREFKDRFAGTYTFDETSLPTGWQFTSLSCVDNALADHPSSIGTSGTTATIGLAAQGDVTCTYTNTAQATLIVKKVTEPAPNTTDSFGFTGPGGDTGTLKNGETFTRANLSPGQYVWTENDPTPAFDLKSVTCNDANSVGSKANRTATFNLEAGETVTCTFTNTQRGRIDVTKTDDGSPAAALQGAVFTLFNNAEPLAAPRGAEDTTTGLTCTTGSDGKCSFTNVVPGNYWVVETTTPAGYTTAADQAAVVGAGGTVSLTFVDPRQFTVIVLVCKNADTSLYPSTVTLDGVNKTSLGSAPAGLTASDLCGLGGATYSPKAVGDHGGNVNIPQ
jgi:hypothetical protein